MKKLLVLILAAVMAFAMTGAVMAEEADAEDVEFTWNGQKEVWAILPTTGVPGLLVHADTMGYEMEKEGWTYVTKDANGEPAKQVEFVEDAIAAGNVGALLVAAMDLDMLKAVCGEAREAGIAIVMLGVAPDYPVAGYVATAYEITGEYAVKTAEDWLLNRLEEGGDIPANEDGKYEVAVDYYTDIIDGIYRANATFGFIEESDNLVVVSATQAYGNSAFTDAYDNAQTALEAHPNCRIFICYEPDESMGAALACADYADKNGLDLADFCVISCYSRDDTFLSMCDEVAADHSANAVKGFSSYAADGTEEQNEAFHAVEKYANDLSYSTAGLNLATMLLGVCGSENYEWTYNTPFFDDVFTWNVYGYELSWKQGDENTALKYRVDQFLF